MLQPNQHQQMEDNMAKHQHEHPEPFIPSPLIDGRVLDYIRAALEAGPASPLSDLARHRLQSISRIIDAVELAAMVARIIADHSSEQHAWLSTALMAIAEAGTGSLNAEKGKQLKRSDEEEKAFITSSTREAAVTGGSEVTPQPLSSDEDDAEEQKVEPWEAIFSPTPLVDLLIGMTYASDGNLDAVRDQMQSIVAVLATILPVLDAGLAAATAPLTDIQLKATLTALVLSEAPDHQKHIAPRADAFLERIRRLLDEWMASNPISVLLARCHEVTLTEKIIQIKPSSADPSDTVTLLADVANGQGFGAEPSTHIALFGRDGRTTFPIRSWEDGRVIVIVPQNAVTGPIFFAPGLDEPTIVAEMQRSKHILEREWMTTVFPVLDRVGLRRPFPHHTAHITVRIAPQVAQAYVQDADGVRIETVEQLIHGRRPFEVHWRVDHAQPDTGIDLVDGNVVIAHSLTPSGNMRLPDGYDTPMRLGNLAICPAPPGAPPPSRADTGRPGPGQWTPIIPQRIGRFISVPLLIEPSMITLTVSSAQDERRDGPEAGSPDMQFIRVRFPEPLSESVTLDVESDSERVDVTSEASPIPAGRDSFFILAQAWAYDRDHPEQPCAHISINASSEHLIYVYEGTLDVWVQPRGGKWELVGDAIPGGPGDADNIPGRIPGDRLQTVGIHATLLDTGQMLFFSPPHDVTHLGHQDEVETELWDPTTRTSILPPPDPPPSPTRNLFCAGHCHLPDGRVLIAGGHAVTPSFGFRSTDWSVHIFDPHASAASRWSRLEDMTEPRWYPTCTVLPDGRALILSGSAAGAYAPVLWPSLSSDQAILGSIGWTGDSPTIFTIHLSGGTATSIDVLDPTTNHLQRFPDAHFLDSFADTYPFVCVLPSGPGYQHGALLVIERDNLHYFSYEPAGIRSPLASDVHLHLAFPARRTFPKYGSGVLLPIHATNPSMVRYLVVGGGDERSPFLHTQAPATDTVEIIDFSPSLHLPNQRPPNLSRTRRLANRRFMSDAVLLADGNVLICGGAQLGITNVNSHPVKQAEIFDSLHETLMLADSEAVERRYHSTHVLLPDGIVQATGSTGGYPPALPNPQFRVEIYRPSYLWRGPRPTIANAPTLIRYGSQVTINTPDASRINRVALVKLASVTHANNMDQRYVELPIVAIEVSQPARPTDHVIVDAPRDGTIAPPGPYMLFLIDQIGVPSRAQIVFVR